MCHPLDCFKLRYKSGGSWQRWISAGQATTGPRQNSQCESGSSFTGWPVPAGRTCRTRVDEGKRSSLMFVTVDFLSTCFMPPTLVDGQG